MSTKFSAYLSIYNEWDLLEPMLRSIAPYVDELVVVDGAYAWMANHLANAGCDPLRSDPRMYEAIENSRIPYRVITKLWANEIEKRVAGYAACKRRYILRIDADEVIFFDEPELERFLSQGTGVGEVEMPTYIAPGWVMPIKNQQGVARLPCHPILFDSHRIRPAVHLNYLWLVLGAEALPHADVRPVSVYRPPIAFNAHLQTWRKWTAATQRAEFYILQQVRDKGVSWLKQLQGKPVNDLSALFDIVPIEQFRDIMRASRHGSQGFYSDNLLVAPTPITPEQEASFSDCYVSLLANLAEFNKTLLTAGLHFATHWPIYIDISAPACLDPLVEGGAISFEFSCKLHNVKANWNTISSSQPWFTTVPLEAKANGHFLSVRIPETLRSQNCLRRQIQLQVNTDAPGTVQKFHIRKSGSSSPAL